MKSVITLKQLFFFAIFIFCSSEVYSQCFQIESILVDACDTGLDEGLNEMVRFKIGNAPVNTSNMSVNWPNNNWQGLIQNTTTAAKVLTLNQQITAAGGCGQLIQPTGGVLPANAKVILVTSFNFNVALNSFGAITENIYILFQNNPTTTTGHFANYNTALGARTLSISFGSCSDTVTYERSLLINTNGGYGGSAALNDGSTVNFSPSGTPTYINNGCVAPVEVFAVNAGASPVTACPGATISLAGTAQGQQSVTWSAATGTFSSSGALVTNYTISPTASGPIVLTLTATNSCGQTKTSTVTINVGGTLVPQFAPVAAVCAGANLSALPLTSINGVTGTWSPALNNTITTTYTFTPAVGQCATTTTLTITVNQNVVPAFNPILPICVGAVLAPLPLTSLNGITGIWTPVLNTSVTATYTFTPLAGQCASTTTLTVTVNPLTVPTFSQVAPICSGTTLSPLPTTSTNNITGTWSPALNNTATTTYTFTPNAGQCATVTTMIIVVNSVTTTPTFNPIASICSGTNLAPLPTTSINGINGTWSPALNNTATTTYTFTPGAGQCSGPATLTITVDPVTVPTFNAVAAICTGDNLPPLPTTSLNGITGNWSPALNNTATTTYTFTPTAGQCAGTASLTITVNSAATIPAFNPVAAVCVGSTINPLPTTSTNGITGVWSPALNNTATTEYTFTPNAGQCAAPTTLTITVQSGFDFTISGACVNKDFVLRANVADDLFDLSDSDFKWEDSKGATIGSNNPALNVTQYLNSTSATEPFPMTISLTVTSIEGCVLTKPFVVENVYCDIQKGISPNNDGKNDFFDLTRLNVKQLTIFNRYGTKVYSKTTYSNQWYGQADNGNTLPDGTYYYALEFGDNQPGKTGWIYINK